MASLAFRRPKAAPRAAKPINGKPVCPAALDPLEAKWRAHSVPPFGQVLSSPISKGILDLLDLDAPKTPWLLVGLSGLVGLDRLLVRGGGLQEVIKL